MTRVISAKDVIRIIAGTASAVVAAVTTRGVVIVWKKTRCLECFAAAIARKHAPSVAGWSLPTALTKTVTYAPVAWKSDGSRNARNRPNLVNRIKPKKRRLAMNNNDVIPTNMGRGTTTIRAERGPEKEELSSPMSLRKVRIDNGQRQLVFAPLAWLKL